MISRSSVSDEENRAATSVGEVGKVSATGSGVKGDMLCLRRGVAEMRIRGSLWNKKTALTKYTRSPTA